MCMTEKQPKTNKQTNKQTPQHPQQMNLLILMKWAMNAHKNYLI